MLETDLFPPVQRLFEEQGYIVNAEVLDCDMVAKNEEETVIIELKTSFNLKLVHQIVKRQTYSDVVYAAIPRPNLNYRSKRWDEIFALVKRLDAGLIIVSEVDGFAYAEVAVHPKSYTGRKNVKKQKKLSQETENRTMNFNIGGVTRSKLMTAYRENALFIVCCLALKGDMKPKEIQEYGTGNKTGSILLRNFYGWFTKTEEGLYTITDAGKNAMQEYQALTEHYNRKIEG